MEWHGIAGWLADTGSGCLVTLFFSFIYLFIYLDLVEEEGESLFMYACMCVCVYACIVGFIIKFQIHPPIDICDEI